MLQSALDGDGDSAASAAAVKLWAGCASTGFDLLVCSFLQHAACAAAWLAQCWAVRGTPAVPGSLGSSTMVIKSARPT
jgi:hypothetical protein